MRNVTASEFVSVDGVMEDPSWTFQFDALADHLENEDEDQ